MLATLFQSNISVSLQYTTCLQISSNISINKFISYISIKFLIILVCICINNIITAFLNYS